MPFCAGQRKAGGHAATRQPLLHGSPQPRRPRTGFALRGAFSTGAALDKRYELIGVFEVVVVADDARAMIDDPCSLIALRAVEEAPDAALPGKPSEHARLELKPPNLLATVKLPALKAVADTAGARARPDLAAVRIGARAGVATVASVVLRAQAASEPAPRYSQIPAHRPPSDRPNLQEGVYSRGQPGRNGLRKNREASLLAP